MLSVCDVRRIRLTREVIPIDVKSDFDFQARSHGEQI